VFLSHTSELGSFVAAAQDAVTRAGDVTVEMEYFTAHDVQPCEYSARMVASTDIYVGIVGSRYGSPVRSTPDRSYTELEFDTATALGLPRLVFLLVDERQRCPPAATDGDHEHRERQAAFRRRLQEEAGLTVSFVRKPEELGIRLYQALVELRQPPSVSQPRPRELPADAAFFTGRHQELEALDNLASATVSDTPALVISVVSGTAGVGKTALAVHWAHRVMDRFPDGNLYVDLQGYDPHTQLAPADALGHLLRALGVENAAIPDDIAERAARFRTRTAGRRILMVLDNARDAEQVRLLLPGHPSCLVVVTSRDSLGPLVVHHGARRIDLDRPPLEDAIHMLRTLVGPRVDDEPRAALELVVRCARLPLALRIAGERVASQHERRIDELVRQLADERRSLDLFDAGDDPRTALRTVFSCSYRQLPDAAARLFRLLGLHPGRDIDIRSAAALARSDLGETARQVDVLFRAHLVERIGPARVGMHDLMRAYAREMADKLPADERRVALTALFDHAIDTAAAAIDVLDPCDRCHHRRAGAKPGIAPVLPTAEQARAWLDTERSNLVAMVAWMASHGWSERAVLLARTLCPYLDRGAHYSDALVVHRHALHAARGNDDVPGTSTALNSLGQVWWRLGRPQEALERLQEALRLRRQIGDREGETETLMYIGVARQKCGDYEGSVRTFEEALHVGGNSADRSAVARSLGNLGIGLYWAGRYAEAEACLQQALRIHHERGGRDGDPYVMGNLGALYLKVGRYEEAFELSQRSLHILRELRDRVSEAGILGNIGVIHMRQGRYDEALSCLRQTLDIIREVGGDQLVQAEALDCLGLVHSRKGELAVAIGYHQAALHISQEVGNRHLEATALNGLGEALRANGRHDAAQEAHQAALSLATDAGNRFERARALDGLACLRDAAGWRQDARTWWQEAATLYAELRVPEMDDVQRRLAGPEGA
jgi:tetratricopeptide (TPR) repeat protein